VHASTEEASDTGQEEPLEPVKKPVLKEAVVVTAPASASEPSASVDQAPHAPHHMTPRQPYRQKFQPRWPNAGPPRWNHIPPGAQPQQMPFQRGPNMAPRPPMMGPGGPGPQRPMRPFGPQLRQPFNFNNNFMQSRPPLRPPPMSRPRFFYPNHGPPMGDPSMQGFPPSNQMGGGPPPPGLPRKVLINPNFKGGVEAAKSESQ
jgi:hypothetical protein